MLEIGGGGDPRSFAAVSRLAETLGAGHVRLVGPVDHASVPAFLNEATALILPSRRESFGMVFSEALMAGCPVVHGKGSGIDGYFAGASFARPVNVKDASAVASVIVEMVLNENEIKEALLSAQKDGVLNCLQRESIRECYLRSIGNITKDLVEQKCGTSRSLLA
jgi:glycosyltransferase involved in cell wall biosynthesis